MTYKFREPKPKIATSSDPIRMSDYPHKHQFSGYPRTEVRCKICGEKRPG